MRSPLFQERLTDRYDLLYLRVSGPVYQSSSNDHVDMWFPDDLRCDRCWTPFESREELSLHLQSPCKYKCIFCRRTYCSEESLLNHVCPKGEKSAKEKRKRMHSYVMKTIGKRCRVDVDQVDEGKESESSPAEKNDLKLVPVMPRSDGEANLDVELTSLLERWYGGQNEELEELTNLDLEAIEPAGNGLSAAMSNETSPPKPAISVKPISQLIGSPPQQPLLNPVAALDTRPYNDVIEIEDEADSISRALVPTTVAGQQQVGSKPEQQSLSESDILNIVKHFRGIDENESYLIKAKINGASKLICISKRKGEAGTVPSATIVNNSSSGQANGGSSSSGSSSTSKPAQTAMPQAVRRPIISTSPPPLVSTVTNTTLNRNPTLTKKPTIKYVPRRAHMKHTTGSINGPKVGLNIPSTVAAPMPPTTKVSTPPQAAPMPQLKIAHVESLVAPSAISHQQQPRVLNGPMLNPGMQQYNRSTASTVKNTNSISPGNSGVAQKQAPRRIIVGSNSIKMLNNPRTIVPKPQPQPMARSPPKPIVTTTSTQQRIVVQRKQIKTVVQSTVRRTSSGGSITQSVAPPSGGPGGNSLLRSQLLQPQQPPRIYPGPSGAGGMNAGVATSADQLLSSLTSSNRQFKLNNTTFKRLE
uniref:Uncharacterized protein n=1 Tax=Culex tarsalis TaxID=7177 RepID=A0A1Q3EWY4_CULTA